MTDVTTTIDEVPIRAVVFDLDGTLVDSAPDIARALASVLEPLGGRRLDLDEVKGLLGNGPVALVRGSMELSGAQIGNLSVDDLTERYLAECRAHPVVESSLFDGVEALLAGLATNDIACGVCTNKSGDIASLVLEDLGVREYFPVVLGADQVAASKPEPGHLLAVIDGLGATAASCLYVGDTRIDEQTATRAGVRFVAVPWADADVGARLEQLVQIAAMTKAGDRDGRFTRDIPTKGASA